MKTTSEIFSANLRRLLEDKQKTQRALAKEMRPKQKKENPQKYIDRLNRLNEIYIMGNIYADEYKRQSAALQQKIAELQKITPRKTQNFSADWKEIYAILDDEHKRSFWHGLISKIVPSIENSSFSVLY